MTTMDSANFIDTKWAFKKASGNMLNLNINFDGFSVGVNLQDSNSLLQL